MKDPSMQKAVAIVGICVGLFVAVLPGKQQPIGGIVLLPLSVSRSRLIEFFDALLNRLWSGRSDDKYIIQIGWWVSFVPSPK